MSELSREDWQNACSDGEWIAREAFTEMTEQFSGDSPRANQMVYGACLGLITETSRMMRMMAKPTPEGYANLEYMILGCARGAARGLDYPVDADGQPILEAQ